jgi:hypothetical protein
MLFWYLILATKFDNAILNPNHLNKDHENRPFFTEGTDLFNIGNLFYSRRIGGEPTTVPKFDDEEVTNYPIALSINNKCVRF